jgi:hypothetical protein
LAKKSRAPPHNRHKQTEEKCVALAIENWGKCEVFYDAIQRSEHQRYASHAGNAEEKPEPLITMNPISFPLGMIDFPPFF